MFCYLEDNHTSVVGVREVAARRGAALACVTGEDVLLLPGNAEEAASKLRGDARETLESREEEVESSWGDSVGPHPLCPRDHAQLPSVYHLFAYPAQSNFSGRKYPLRWASDLPLGRAHLRGLEGLVGAWLVLLDAAAYVPTSPLDLSSSPAHFVCLSFYKMFGYPTGLGALLVRRDVGHLLCKDYYGGGTVLASISRDNFHIAKHLLHERWVIGGREGRARGVGVGLGDLQGEREGRVRGVGVGLGDLQGEREGRARGVGVGLGDLQGEREERVRGVGCGIG